jgi:polysaccharide biosynthesis protein PslG
LKSSALLSFCLTLFIHSDARAQANPAPFPASGSLTPFGIGSCYVNGRSIDDYSRWVPQISDIGVRFIRTTAVQWNAVEPEEGKWNWKDVDAQMAYLKERQIECGALLLGTPGWNKTDAGGSLPVNNLPAWSRYVSEVVKHLKGRVKYFEVWNEPPNFTGKNQTPADYAKIVVAAYDAAKAANPDAMVGLAAKSAHVNYLEQVIQAGAKDHFDWITLHPYEVLDSVASNAGTEPVFMSIVPTLRKMLTVQNRAKADVPVIFTELGCDAKAKGPEVQAHALVKAYAMSIAQGVACIQWFEGRDGDSGPMGLLNDKGVPRPAYHALAQMITHLGQRPRYLGWVLLNDRNYGFLFEGAKGKVLITWTPATGSDRIDFGQLVHIVNPLTKVTTRAESHELTASPIFVLDPPSKLVTLAQENKSKPIPWGGDFRDAVSVSIEMGERNIEKGLHTLSGQSVAEAVVAYGGSARAGDVPGGNMFVVDPGFLSYTSTPIEIAAVVRRNAENKNAGFKLVYESTRGFNTAGGWYTIPDNKQWHTVTWKIEDPQFVNYWGYNFSLVSDGDEYNKYYIQSVTVKKLAK